MDFSIIACYLFGALFIFFGVASLVQALHSKRVCTREISAEVVDYEVKHDSGGKHGIAHDHYFPILSFYAEGKQIRKVSSTGYDRRIYNIGDMLDILYEPEHPENFIVAGAQGGLSVSLIISLMGVGVFVIAVLRTLGIME